MNECCVYILYCRWVSRSRRSQIYPVPINDAPPRSHDLPTTTNTRRHHPPAVYHGVWCTCFVPPQASLLLGSISAFLVSWLIIDHCSFIIYIYHIAQSTSYHATSLYPRAFHLVQRCRRLQFFLRGHQASAASATSEL